MSIHIYALEGLRPPGQSLRGTVVGVSWARWREIQGEPGPSSAVRILQACVIQALPE